MAEFNKILWSLDNVISAQDFERLCVDLLAREGYRNINPIGAQKDQGRDAESRIWIGSSQQSETTIFQFSTQERWQEKLVKDLKKIALHCRDATEFVFVSSRHITGETQTRLRQRHEVEYGCRVIFYAREWLRHRITEFHPDLARKYNLTDAIQDTLPSVVSKVGLFESESEFEHLDPEIYPPEVLRSLLKNPV